MEAEIARLAESGDTLFTVTDQENTIVGLVIGAKAGKELGECNLGALSYSLSVNHRSLTASSTTGRNSG